VFRGLGKVIEPWAWAWSAREERRRGRKAAMGRYTQGYYSKGTSQDCTGFPGPWVGWLEFSEGSECKNSTHPPPDFPVKSAAVTGILPFFLLILKEFKDL
jgi:hypothetical protein